MRTKSHGKKILEQLTSKYTIEPVLCWPSIAGHVLRSGLYTQWDAIGENFFSNLK